MKTNKLYVLFFLILPALAFSAESKDIKIYESKVLGVKYVNCADIKTHKAPKRDEVYIKGYLKSKAYKKMKNKGVFMFHGMKIYDPKRRYNNQYNQMTLYKINKQKINNHAELEEFLKSCKSGDKLKFYFYATEMSSKEKKYTRYFTIKE